MDLMWLWLPAALLYRMLHRWANSVVWKIVESSGMISSSVAASTLSIFPLACYRASVKVNPVLRLSNANSCSARNELVAWEKLKSEAVEWGGADGQVEKIRRPGVCKIDFWVLPHSEAQPFKGSYRNTVITDTVCKHGRHAQSPKEEWLNSISIAFLHRQWPTTLFRSCLFNTQIVV